MIAIQPTVQSCSPFLIYGPFLKQTTLASQLISNMKHNKSLTRQAVLSVCVCLPDRLSVFPLSVRLIRFICVNLSFCLPNCCPACLPIHLPIHYVLSRLVYTSVITTKQGRYHGCAVVTFANEHNDIITEQQLTA